MNVEKQMFQYLLYLILKNGLQVHESRLLPKNIEIAFERMELAVDRHLNGENCYEEQLARLQMAKVCIGFGPHSENSLPISWPLF